MISLLNQTAVSTILFILGRKATFRMGRAIYQHSRGDSANNMKSNGELLVQKCVVDAWKGRVHADERFVVLDVGAHIGDWSLAMLAILEASSLADSFDLYAFEPVPATLRYMKKRLGMDNPYIHYEECALSSIEGEGTIYTSGVYSGVNSLHAASVPGDIQPIAVLLTTVTAFCDNSDIGRIQLLKCDAEGHDMEVMRGALPLLIDGRISVFQFEYNYRWIYARSYIRDVFVALERLPYSLAKLQPKELWYFDEWHPEMERFFEGNYALVHTDALDWFPSKRVSWDSLPTL